MEVSVPYRKDLEYDKQGPVELSYSKNLEVAVVTENDLKRATPTPIPLETTRPEEKRIVRLLRVVRKPSCILCCYAHL